MGCLLRPDDTLICIKAHRVSVGLGLRLQHVDMCSLLLLGLRNCGAGLASGVADDRLGLRVSSSDRKARSLL